MFYIYLIHQTIKAQKSKVTSLFYICLIHQTVKAQKAKVTSFTPQMQASVISKNAMQDPQFSFPSSM